MIYEALKVQSLDVNNFTVLYNFRSMKKKKNNKKHSENADTSTSVTFDLEL